MSEYQRFVAYFHVYDNGVKGANKGFVKADVRGGQCRLALHMRGVFPNSRETLLVFAFIRKEEKLLGIRLGEIRPMNGCVECKLVIPEQDFLDRGYAFADLGGLFIQGAGERHYITSWDDEDVVPEMFAELEQPDDEKPLEAAETAEVKAAQEDEEPSVQMWSKEKPLEAALVSCTPEEEEIPEPFFEEESFSPEDYWAQFFEECEHITPFLDAEIFDCIRIEPKNLVQLPKEEWILGNNSFLLRGYYRYRYLLLGKMMRDGKVCIVLGVPGVFCRQERKMAQAFGFSMYKTADHEEAGRQHRVYWLRMVA